MRIRIKKVGKSIYFDQYLEVISKEELNVTNILNFKEIIFEEEKLEDDFVKQFLKTLFIKENIETVIITTNKILVPVLSLLKDFPILKIKLIEKNVFPASCFDLLESIPTLQLLECYQISEFLFLQANQKLKIEVHTTKPNFVKSNFMIANDLLTFSKLYYKKKIVMHASYTRDDYEDFQMFLKQNRFLEQIDFYSYQKDSILKTISYLLLYQKKNIRIILHQQNLETKEMQQSYTYVLKKLKQDLDLAHITLHLSYTKAYQEKVAIKQVNLNLLKKILLLVTFIFSFLYIISKIQLNNSKKEIASLPPIETPSNEATNTSPLEDEKEENPNSNQTSSSKNEYENFYKKNIVELSQINSETVGWLDLNNTTIHYPVVQHKDNTYYLNHSFAKKSNLNGWIFMDYRNHKDRLDQNTIIYGHDSTEKIMFGDLKTVLKKNWYTNKDNQIITYQTKQQTYRFQIFSIYTTTNLDNYMQVVFSTQELQTFLEDIVKNSIYDFHTPVTTKDKILTLSTCYRDSSKRLVVHAKLIA